MKLNDYIKKHHNNNISAFSRTQGVRQDQVARWLKRNCMCVDGVVYCEVSKQGKGLKRILNNLESRVTLNPELKSNEHNKG